MAAAAAALLAACATPPPGQAVAPMPAREVASRLTLQDRSGAVSQQTQAGDLARLRAEGKGALLQRQLGVLAATGEADLYRGNTARLLLDGPQTFAAMKAAIAAARTRVLLQSYIVEDEGVAAEFAELLLRKAAEGVDVALLYDAIGSIGSDAAFFQRLQAGGVAVCAYNPLNPLERPGRWNPLQRNHRKMLVADADVVFTGGINISNVYAEGSFGSRRRPLRDKPGTPPRGWRDTQIELRGPVVAPMAAVFRETWAEQGCPGELVPAPRPTQAASGQRVVKVVVGDPRHGVNPSYEALLAAIQNAASSVHLTMAYFAPGPELVQALCDAAARGVEVKLVLPGRSDVKLVLHAARSYYTQLLRAGVQIHEMRNTVMHAKTAVVDGVYSSVGSSNLDWRSILANDEIDVIVLGDDFGQELEAVFQRDLMVSTPIDATAWQQRGVGERLLERFGRLVEPLL